MNILTVPDQSGVKALDWSVDGQLIAASTAQGSLYVFVTKLSMLSAVCFPRIAILSSLAEVSIYNFSLEKQRKPICVMPLEIEPSVIAVGPNHFACAMNNHAWFYDLNSKYGDLPTMLGDREYIAEITNIKLNGKFCAALIAGKVSLHPVSRLDIHLLSYSKTLRSFCMNRLRQTYLVAKINKPKCFPKIRMGCKNL